MSENEALVRNNQSYGLDTVKKMAESIAKSGLFGMKSPNEVFALMLVAQAEGRHPASVARDYDIIQGRPAKKAEAMLRDFQAAGGSVQWHKLDDTCAKATFTHPQGTATIEWTMERAKQAGLAGKDNYKKWPRQMLRCRTTSEGVRTVYPGATSGMYVPEEIIDGDIIDDDSSEHQAAIARERMEAIKAQALGGSVEGEEPTPKTDARDPTEAASGDEDEAKESASDEGSAPQSPNRRELAKAQFQEDCLEMSVDEERALEVLLWIKKKDSVTKLTAEDYEWVHRNPGDFCAAVSDEMARADG